MTSGPWQKLRPLTFERMIFLTIEQVKSDLLATLDSMDKDKLSLPDLRLYADILKTVSGIQAKNFSESMTELLALGSGFGMKPPSVSDLKREG